MSPLSRRDLLQRAAALAAALAVPDSLLACSRIDPDRERLDTWITALRAEGLAGRQMPLGPAAARVGELAAGSPYESSTLEAYLRAGGSATARFSTGGVST